MFGPQYNQLDMSFFKTIAVTERVKVQFRAESFNFTNHINLAQPNPCVDCAGVAGHIFGAQGSYTPKLWQFALRTDF